MISKAFSSVITGTQSDTLEIEHNKRTWIKSPHTRCDELRSSAFNPDVQPEWPSPASIPRGGELAVSGNVAQQERTHSVGKRRSCNKPALSTHVLDRLRHKMWESCAMTCGAAIVSLSQWARPSCCRRGQADIKTVRAASSIGSDVSDNARSSAAEELTAIRAQVDEHD